MIGKALVVPDDISGISGFRFENDRSATIHAVGLRQLQRCMIHTVSDLEMYRIQHAAHRKCLDRIRNRGDIWRSTRDGHGIRYRSITRGGE